MENDDGFSTITCSPSDAQGTAPSLNNEEQSRQVSSRSAGKLSSFISNKTKAHFPKNLQALAQMKNHVTARLRGCAIDESLSFKGYKMCPGYFGNSSQDQGEEKACKGWHAHSKREARHQRHRLCRIRYRKQSIHTYCTLLFHRRQSSLKHLFYKWNRLQAWKHNDDEETG